MPRKLITATFAFLIAMSGSAATIRIHGSSTMAELNARLSADYEREHPDVKFDIVTSDSAKGIADLIAGRTEIAAASRQIKPEESAKAKAVGMPVARDGVSIYVHPSNKVASLTLQQLADIFSGRITNWSGVGGASAPITLYVRESTSGTAEFFREHTLGSKTASYGRGAKELTSSADVIAAVSKDRNAIGYAGAASSGGAKTLALQKAGGKVLQPTRQTVASGEYPLSRILYYYVAGLPDGDVQKFMQWVLSPAGQKAVAKAGFFAAR